MNKTTKICVGAICIVIGLLMLLGPSIPGLNDLLGGQGEATLSNCDQLTKWSKSALGTLTLDNEIFHSGTGAVRLTVTQKSGTTFAELGPMFDLSIRERAVSAWLFVPAAADLSSLRLFVFATRTYDSWAQIPVTVHSGWNEIIVPYNSVGWVGTNFTDSSWDTIYRVRFTAASKDDFTTTFVSIDDVKIVSLVSASTPTNTDIPTPTPTLTPTATPTPAPFQEPEATPTTTPIATPETPTTTTNEPSVLQQGIGGVTICLGGVIMLLAFFDSKKKK